MLGNIEILKWWYDVRKYHNTGHLWYFLYVRIKICCLDCYTSYCFLLTSSTIFGLDCPLFDGSLLFFKEILTRYMTGFERSLLPHIIIKIRKTHFNYLKYYILERKTDTYLHVVCQPFYSYSQSIYTPTVEWVSSWIAHHFQIVFTG